MKKRYGKSGPFRATVLPLDAETLSFYFEIRRYVVVMRGWSLVASGEVRYDGCASMSVPSLHVCSLKELFHFWDLVGCIHQECARS